MGVSADEVKQVINNYIGTIKKVGSGQEQELLAKAVQIVRDKLSYDDYHLVAERLNECINELKSIETEKADTNVEELMGSSNAYWNGIHRLSNLHPRKEYNSTAVGAMKGVRDACAEVTDKPITFNY